MTIAPKPTSRRQAAASTQEKAIPGQLKRTLDNMIGGCQIISFDYRYIYVNKMVTKQGHKTKQQLLGHTMMEMYPGIEKTKMFACLKRCMKNRRAYSMENEFEYPDGGKGWFELRMEPVPEGVLIFSEDISKRKNYERAISVRNKKLEELNKAQEASKRALLDIMTDLKQSKDEASQEKVRDQAILENIGEGLIAIDAGGKVIMMNKAAESLLGWSAKELKGKPITRLTMLDADGLVIPAAERPIHATLEHGKTIGPSFAEYYFRRKDKSRFPIGITVSPIKLNGKIIGAIEIFRDASREQEVDQAKTEFVSIASHQLRTPLGISKWYLEAAKAEGYLDTVPKAAREYLEQVYKSNERVLSVVRDLLSVSRIDQGRIKDNPGKTDVAKLVRETVSDMALMAHKKKIKLELSIGHKPPAVYIDSLRLHEVIQNLIANALQYTLAGGAVKVTLGQKAGELTVSVKDSGIGMSKQDRQKLFTKFFRSERAVSHYTDGSGLGLYVVKSYVEDWGGRVLVSSQENKGSTFSITLPIKRGGRK